MPSTTPTHRHFVLSPAASFARIKRTRWRPIELNDRHLRYHGKITDSLIFACCLLCIRCLLCRTFWNFREHALSDFISIIYDQRFRGAPLVSMKIEHVPFPFPTELFLRKRHPSRLLVTHCIKCLKLKVDAADLQGLQPCI